MKKMGILFLFLPLLLIGCSSGGHLVKFNNSELKSQLADYDFQPELPTKLPFEVEETQFSPPPKEIQPSESFNFDFYGSGRNIFLHTVRGKKVSSNLEEEFEEVQIGEVKGSILVPEKGPITLQWTENDVHYRLKYFDEGSGSEVTKEDLIETAKSFE